MKYLLFLLVPVIAFSIGCAPTIIGTPIEKAKLEKIVPGTTTEENLVSMFGTPFKKEAIGAGETKYTYTYFAEYPRAFTKNAVIKQTLEVYAQGGLINRYELKDEEVQPVRAADR